MKIYLKNIILVNRAPINDIRLEFEENEIAVLTAINGSGKTTILSHIIDAWHEIARPHFISSYEGKENMLYRISNSLLLLDNTLPSFVYIRFIVNSTIIDYVDIRGKCNEQQYHDAITLVNTIPFSELASSLESDNFVKKTSSSLNKELASLIFNNNVVTYFPSYRFEQPGYLNDPYKIQLNFKLESRYSGYLINPIEVISGLPKLANWIMDIVLDMRSSSNLTERILFTNLNQIVSQTLIGKNEGVLRFGIGPRGFGNTRIQIMSQDGSKQIYPSIFNLSSGETAMLSIFAEILRQADNCGTFKDMHSVTGVVLIDEVDKHLHIKLQKEVVPALLNLFPNVQFILSTHSPFLNMGLAEKSLSRSKIVDLDNLGISKDLSTNKLFTEVYEMMTGENKKFKEAYEQLTFQLVNETRPLIITEGKTDSIHIRKALEQLHRTDIDIDFYQIESDWGDSKLKVLLEQLAKIRHKRKIIGIFDRDVRTIVASIEDDNQEFKDYGNNVFGMCIPVPPGRENYQNISIEFFYDDAAIKKINDGRRLYFDNEIDNLYNKSTNSSEFKILESPRIEKELSKKIFDEPKMCEINNKIHSKANFASLIESDLGFISDIDFSSFNLIFERMALILAT